MHGRGPQPDLVGPAGEQERPHANREKKDGQDRHPQPDLHRRFREIPAAEGDGELPVAVRTWLEEWSDNTRPGMAALAALLRQRSPSADAEPATLRFLRDLAERAGLEFFVGEFPASRATSSPSLWFEPGATLDARPARQSSLVSP